MKKILISSLIGLLSSPNLFAQQTVRCVERGGKFSMLVNTNGPVLHTRGNISVAFANGRTSEYVIMSSPISKAFTILDAKLKVPMNVAIVNHFRIAYNLTNHWTSKVQWTIGSQTKTYAINCTPLNKPNFN